MKKIKEFIFFVILFSLFISSLGNSKIIKFDENFNLNVPSNYSSLKFTDQIEGIDIQEMEKYGMQAYFLGDKKLINAFEYYLIHNEFNDYFTNIQKKLESKARNSNSNQIMKYFLRILKKENIQSITVAVKSDKFLDELEEFGFNISDLNEFNQLSDEELVSFNKEIKSYISDYVLSLGAISYKIKSFKLSKDKSNDFFSFLKASSLYAINDDYTFKTTDEGYATFKNNSLYLIYRLCFVDCINYNNFKKMVKPISSASKSINQDNVIKNNNFINQLKQLNELYKSGVLTKEEFEKAKKRILN